MNADQLKAYKREKSRLFNAKMRDLRLRDKEKKQTADQQPDNTIDKQDELSLQDVMDIFETLDTKLDLIQTKLENKIDELLNNVDRLLDIKLDELFNRLDIIESIIENKLENKMETKLETIMENKLYEPLENKQPTNRLPSIFFA